MNLFNADHSAESEGRHSHSEPRFDLILQLFFRQDAAQMTPSEIAYQLDISGPEAEALLDEMVKHSLLELDFDDNGQLFYTVEADVLMNSEHRKRQPTVHQSAASVRPATAGANGSIGRPTPQAANPDAAGPSPRGRRRPRHAHSSAGPNGCDGSVGHPADSWRAAETPRPGRQANAGPARGPSTGPPPNPPRRPRPDVHHDPSSGGQLVHQPQNRRLPSRRRRPHPLVAGVLSALFVGSGQLYNRQVGKGLAMFLGSVILWTFSMGWIINIWSVIDAYNVAAASRSESATA